MTQEHSNQIKKSNEKFETADLNPAIDTFSAEAHNHKSTALESGPCAASAPSVIPTIHQQGSLHKFCVTIILNFNDRLPTAFKENTFKRIIFPLILQVNFTYVHPFHLRLQLGWSLGIPGVLFSVSQISITTN